MNRVSAYSIHAVDLSISHRMPWIMQKQKKKEKRPIDEKKKETMEMAYSSCSINSNRQFIDIKSSYESYEYDRRWFLFHV